MTTMTTMELATAMRKTAQNCREHASGGRVNAGARDDVRRLSLLSEQAAAKLESMAAQIQELETDKKLPLVKKTTAKGDK
jgi:hypothetical protein